MIHLGLNNKMNMGWVQVETEICIKLNGYVVSKKEITTTPCVQLQLVLKNS